MMQPQEDKNDINEANQQKNKALINKLSRETDNLVVVEALNLIGKLTMMSFQHIEVQNNHHKKC